MSGPAPAPPIPAATPLPTPALSLRRLVMLVASPPIPISQRRNPLPSPDRICLARKTAAPRNPHRRGPPSNPRRHRRRAGRQHASAQLLDHLLVAAFGNELLLFAHRRPSTAAGIENRYFDLFLVPVTVCLGATLLAAHRPGAAPPRLARAAGLALQGTWMVQMGFSFFTDAIAGGCALHAQSRADYTIKCRTHEDYHRARSVATLQFNGHLALLVLAGAATYAAVISRGNGNPPSGYRMLGKEVQMEGMPLSSQFTLDSDEEKEDEEITTAAPPVANGVHSHHQISVHTPDDPK